MGIVLILVRKKCEVSVGHLSWFSWTKATISFFFSVDFLKGGLSQPLKMCQMRGGSENKI